MFASLCKALLEREPGTPCPIGSPGGGVGGRGGGVMTTCPVRTQLLFRFRLL